MFSGHNRKYHQNQVPKSLLLIHYLNILVLENDPSASTVVFCFLDRLNDLHLLLFITILGALLSLETAPLFNIWGKKTLKI